MERRDLVLRRKRDEYFGFIEQYYHSRTDEHYKDTYRQVTLQDSDSLEHTVWASETRRPRLMFVVFTDCSPGQIHIDIPRTNPLIPLFQQPTVQEVSGDWCSSPEACWECSEPVSLSQ